MTDKGPADETVTPEWMNKEFFEKIQRNSEKDKSIEVAQLVVLPGSQLGDHYASIMFRVLITFNSSEFNSAETSLIVKTMPFIDGVKKDLLGKCEFFQIETAIYNEVIPMFESVLRAANDDTKIACKCYYSSLEPHQTMVFEDLNRRNFRCPGSMGENMSQVAMKSLEKLAKWHAISLKLNSEDGLMSKNFQNGAFSGLVLEDFPLFRDGLHLFLDMLGSDADFDQYVPMFEKLKADGFLTKAGKGYEAFRKGHPANVFVLNHGDAHLKNIMMNDMNGKLDVLLIDFQVCYWGPAVMDLIYFLYLSIDAVTRNTKREEIIYTYFQTFKETLENIGFTGSVPKLTDLYKDLLSFKDYELLVIMSIMPMVCSNNEQNGDAEDVTQVIENDDFRKNLYSKKVYKEFVKQILPVLLYKGYLD